MPFVQRSMKIGNWFKRETDENTEGEETASDISTIFNDSLRTFNAFNIRTSICIKVPLNNKVNTFLPSFIYTIKYI